MKRLFYGLVPVCRKETLHIVRDRGTLFFALLIPMLQFFCSGLPWTPTSGRSRR